jgi:hypothetical protein
MHTQLGPMWTEGERELKSVNRASHSKGLFLLLSSLSILLLLILLWLVFFLLEPRLSSLGERATAGVGLAFVFAGVAAVVLAGSEFISLSSGVRLFPRFLNQLCAVYFLLPVSEGVGRVLGFPADSVRGAFLEFNNAIVAARVRHVAPERVLVLLPHCLQKSTCPEKLDGDIRNCAECGDCNISALKRLILRHSVESRIVGGGALALQVVRAFEPDAIVGVACERELVAAIKEMRRTPVMAVSNWRPEGPCKNTRVVVEKVEDALWILLKPRNSRCSMQ